MILAVVPSGSHPPLLVVFLLVFARVSGTIVAAPIFGESEIPVQVKVGLSAIVAAILTPQQVQLASAVSSDPAMFAVLLAEQILLGLAFALIFVVIYKAGAAAGEFIGQQMGVTMAESQRPGEVGMHSIAQFYNLIAGLIFLGLDGQHWVFLGLGSGLDAMPVTHVALSSQLLAALLPLGGSAIEFAVGLALPLIITLLLADLITGLLGRAIPSFNLFVLGLPLKVALGVIALLIAAPFTVSLIAQLFEQIPHLSLWQ
jgi:flagellar biosynthesis protein FliR